MRYMFLIYLDEARFEGMSGREHKRWGNAMLDYDEEVRCWRFVHARTAERTIGPEVEGTAASSGVRYLERMATHRASFFPFLWRARADLWEHVQPPATPDS